MKQKFRDLAVSVKHSDVHATLQCALDRGGNSWRYAKLIVTDTEKERDAARSNFYQAWDDAMFFPVDEHRQVKDRQGQPCNKKKYVEWGY